MKTLAVLATVVAVIVAAWTGGAGPTATSAAARSGAGNAATPSPTGLPLTLAIGDFLLPAAGAFGDPGFHQVITVMARVPANLGSATGSRLVLRLWDAGRPGATCRSEHPLSGCATVDWSDAPARPKVPASGVFQNSVTLELVSGPRTFFLGAAGLLQDSPDPFDPG